MSESKKYSEQAKIKTIKQQICPRLGNTTLVVCEHVLENGHSGDGTNSFGNNSFLKF